MNEGLFVGFLSGRKRHIITKENDELKKQVNLQANQIKELTNIIDKLKTQLQTQYEQIEAQQKLIEEYNRLYADDENFRIIYNNDKIIGSMIELIKTSEKFLVILTNRIDCKDINSKKLKTLFDKIQEKASDRKIKLVSIRYNKRHHNQQGSDKRTTKDIITRLLKDRKCLDIEPSVNIHFKCLMNEKAMLFCSNNFDCTSFKKNNNEVGVLVTKSPLNNKIYEDMKKFISKEFDITFPN